MMAVVLPAPFAQLAVAERPRLDELALALAAEFRPVRAQAALERLDALAGEVEPPAAGARGRRSATPARSTPSPPGCCSCSSAARRGCSAS